MIQFENIEDILSNVEDVDAIYMIGGFFLKDDEVERLAKSLIAKKLPSFTTSGIKHVKRGMFATNRDQENIDRFFRRIALSVEAYINGTPLSELNVFIQSSSQLTINYNTAELLEFPIKNSMIWTTDFVGEFKNVRAQKQYNLFGCYPYCLA